MAEQENKYTAAQVKASQQGGPPLTDAKAEATAKRLSRLAAQTPEPLSAPEPPDDPPVIPEDERVWDV